MQHRIRAAALVIQAAKILMVRHRTKANGAEWWIPPGGGVELEDLTIMDCANRETWEETGLTVQCDRIAYIREFSQPEYDLRHVEFFLVGADPTGAITLANLPQLDDDLHLVLEAQWLSRSQLVNLVVYPEILQTDEFWQDVDQGFPQVKYLSRQVY
ncbi:NUDIX hydrolase [filamentous cyanobacterium LEGE 11480]|uniref:NUDIX hydrolase n=1 Tax=Romeriopsis navalis LEGE 11480 TaxID=2777977 RepID=A0A928VIG0_9CYAN|nr:NUDIX hydrolase [Romeriopsis navalis]MBE9029203.1 NUDIX hydrolase [Romeriopsis navalis LEGE 11480]